MASKKKANLAAQKVRKQKIIAAVGGVILLIALGIQAPRILKMIHGDSGPAAAPYKAFPDAVPTAAPLTISSSGKAVLQDPNVQPEADAGQLVDFELFESKDPFAQQVTLPESGGPSDGGGKEDPAAGGDESPQPDQGQDAAATSATLSVNGVEEDVQVGGEFPVDDPAFVLVSAGKGSVRIGIAGGSLATGDDTVTLRRGKTLTLVNTVDGTEYHLRLVALS